VHVGCAGGLRVVRSRVCARVGADGQQRVCAAKPPQQLAYSVSEAGKSQLKRAKVNTHGRIINRLRSCLAAVVLRSAVNRVRRAAAIIRDVQYIYISVWV